MNPRRNYSAAGHTCAADRRRPPEPEQVDAPEPGPEHWLRDKPLSSYEPEAVELRVQEFLARKNQSQTTTTQNETPPAVVTGESSQSDGAEKTYDGNTTG